MPLGNQKNLGFYRLAQVVDMHPKAIPWLAIGTIRSPKYHPPSKEPPWAPGTGERFSSASEQTVHPPNTGGRWGSGTWRWTATLCRLTRRCDHRGTTYPWTSQEGVTRPASPTHGEAAPSFQETGLVRYLFNAGNVTAGVAVVLILSHWMGHSKPRIGDTAPRHCPQTPVSLARRQPSLFPVGLHFPTR